MVKIRKCYLCQNVVSYTVTLFSFPKEQPLRDQWAKFCRLYAEELPKSAFLCSKHFSTDAFKFTIEDGRRLVLKKNSCPTLRPQRRYTKRVVNTAGFRSKCANAKVIEVEEYSNSDIKVEESEVPQVSNGSTPNAVFCYSTHFLANETYTDAGEASNFAKSTKLKKKRKFILYYEDKSTKVQTPKRTCLALHPGGKTIKQSRKKIGKLQHSNDLLEPQLISLETALSKARKANYLGETAVDAIQDYMIDSLKELLLCFLKKKTAEFPLELRKFVLSIHFHSAAAYDYIREMWDNVLPSPNILKTWYSVSGGRPGFSEEVFIALQRMADSGKPVICNIVLDEMSIRKYVDYVNNRAYGYVNMGPQLANEEDDGDSQFIASQVLVFMAVGVNSTWKVPLGYFATYSMTSSERANLLTICLELLHEVGVRICSITIDAFLTNICMCRVPALKANFDYWSTDFQPWIEHPVTKEPIYVLWDPCRMVKLVRNALRESPFFDSKNRIIDWTHIVNLHEKQQQTERTPANQISSRHVNFQDDSNIRLVVQTLSNSVSEALNFWKDTDPKFHDTDGTIEFCKNFNDAFDMLNCCNLFSSKGYAEPLNDYTYDMLKSRAEQLERYIASLKNSEGVYLLESNRKTGFLGIIICLRNIFHIYNQVKEWNVQYLLTYKLLQDHLKNFFSAISSILGLNRDPTCMQFESAYKRLLVHNK